MVALWSLPSLYIYFSVPLCLCVQYKGLTDFSQSISYILPHDIYSSFCVSIEYIFASQKVSGTTIEKIKKQETGLRKRK